MQEYNSYIFSAHYSLGPVEGWIVYTRHSIGFIKGCLHPLPLLYYIPRIVYNTKTWDYKYSIQLLEELEPDLVGYDSCIRDKLALVDPSRNITRLESPHEAYTRVKKTCTSKICQAALELAEYVLGSINDPMYAGFTGGLAYNPEKAGDIDIVVYGFSNAHKVYKLLRDLRSDGKLQPSLGIGHAWSEHDMTLHSLLAPKRLLIGLYKGFEYNVKLVTCTKPGKCFRVEKGAKQCFNGSVYRAYSFTVPALYFIKNSSGDIVVLSYRLRFLEIPVNTVVEVCGIVEKWLGKYTVLVPDHDGYIAILQAPNELE